MSIPKRCNLLCHAQTTIPHRTNKNKKLPSQNTTQTFYNYPFRRTHHPSVALKSPYTDQLNMTLSLITYIAGSFSLRRTLNLFL